MSVSVHNIFKPLISNYLIFCTQFAFSLLTILILKYFAEKKILYKKEEQANPFIKRNIKEWLYMKNFEHFYT